MPNIELRLAGDGCLSRREQVGGKRQQRDDNDEDQAGTPEVHHGSALLRFATGLTWNRSMVNGQGEPMRCHEKISGKSTGEGRIRSDGYKGRCETGSAGQNLRQAASLEFLRKVCTSPCLTME